MWLFYPPIFIGVFFMSIRYLGVRQLSAVNLGMHIGGLVDSNKAKNLLAIQSSLPECVAKTILLDTESLDIASIEEQMRSFGLNYPIILKPNSGQRGLGVAIIKSSQEAERYLATNAGEVLLQEYLVGEEFGVFYMRDPKEQSGFIYSVTHKLFPSVTGDGVSSLEQLILRDPRAIYMADYLLSMHAGSLDSIIKKNEVFQLVEIGSHCRGSLFVDGNTYITEQLTQRIEEIGQSIPGYYFGRFDLRVSSIERFQAGEDIKILEANGLSSESANIYDPKHSLWHAYKTLLKQWLWAFKISNENRQRGAKIASWRDIFSAVGSVNR